MGGGGEFVFLRWMRGEFDCVEHLVCSVLFVYGKSLTCFILVDKHNLGLVTVFPNG